MRASPRFWTAFWAGLAAPIGLYAASDPYAAYIGGYRPPQTFAAIGNFMGRVVGGTPARAWPGIR
jgi:hypothetical protein